MKSIIVVGGGASGLMAAITAAVTARNAGCEIAITVIEASHKVGRSILAAGNGRCNFYNSQISMSAYRSSSFVKEVFCSLSAAWEASFGIGSRLKPGWSSACLETIFESLGLCWQETEDGWCYPLSGKASSVLEVLTDAMATLPIEVRTECAATAVSATGPDQWHIKLESGEILHGNAVIVACGGKGLNGLSLPEEVEITPQKPILGALAIREARQFRNLDGFRVKCRVSLARPAKAEDGSFAPALHDLQDSVLVPQGYKVVAAEVGEVLFRKYGISGIAIFNLSRQAQPGDKLLLDFCPQVREIDFLSYLNRRVNVLRTLYKPLTFKTLLAGMIVQPLSTHLIKASGYSPEATVAKGDARKLVSALKASVLTVVGIHDPHQCQVLRGGLPVKEWDALTLQNKALPGLFAAGEALDVDGPCGGYNLTWAWASGVVAGGLATLSLCDESYQQEFPYFCRAFVTAGKGTGGVL